MTRAERYKIQIDGLFQYWKRKPVSGSVNHSEGVFISDGVVDPDTWFNQECRPLFLLKEAYNGESDWSLTNHLREGTERCGATWRRVSQWTEGLLNTTKDAIHPFWQQGTVRYGNKFLRRIAVMNVKTSGGKKRSNDQELLEYAEFDKLELSEQRQLVNMFCLMHIPVIICGYTIQCLNRILPIAVKERAGQSPNLYYWAEINQHPVLILDYWHPSNQYPDFMNYYGLVGAYQQALKEEENNDRRDFLQG